MQLQSKMRQCPFCTFCVTASKKVTYADKNMLPQNVRIAYCVNMILKLSFFKHKRLWQYAYRLDERSQSNPKIQYFSHSTQCTLIACAQMSLMSAHADEFSEATVMPAMSDNDVVFCLQLFSKTLTCTLHLI